jgi:hypothetical protein
MEVAAAEIELETFVAATNPRESWPIGPHLGRIHDDPDEENRPIRYINSQVYV